MHVTLLTLSILVGQFMERYVVAGSKLGQGSVVAGNNAADYVDTSSYGEEI
jgi:hypothetical protein